MSTAHEAPDALPSDAALWARSGALALTGSASGPPCLSRAPLPRALQAALDGIRATAPHASDALAALDVRLLGERAAAAGHGRNGRTSPGGYCRLLQARDGWLALSLARGEADRALLPALLELDADQVPTGEPGRLFDWLEDEIADRPVEALVARARLVGMAAAPAPTTPPTKPGCRVIQHGPRRDRDLARPWRVLDCSSLWAGPLATDLLRRCGAQVVKLESVRRPDGARSGPSAFFDRMNAGKASVALDLTAAGGRERLRGLVDAADVVVEASRPRALRQLGVDAEAFVAERSGRVWLSLTGYGRGEPEAGWVAFGDDAAVAAGLAWSVPDAGPLFVGDAIADPMAGVHAALAVVEALRAGGGALLDVSLQAVVAAAMAEPVDAAARPSVDADFSRVRDGLSSWAIEAPRLLPVAGRARGLGADTAAIEREWRGVH